MTAAPRPGRTVVVLLAPLLLAGLAGLVRAQCTGTVLVRGTIDTQRCVHGGRAAYFSWLDLLLWLVALAACVAVHLRHYRAPDPASALLLRRVLAVTAVVLAGLVLLRCLGVLQLALVLPRSGGGPAHPFDRLWLVVLVAVAAVGLAAAGVASVWGGDTEAPGAAAERP